MQHQTELTTLSNDQLLVRIKRSWDIPTYNPERAFESVIGGTMLFSSQKMVYTHKDETPPTFHMFIIKDPKYLITNFQVASIMDEGNHCISKGSIFYENNYCVITWSNAGHI